MRAPWIPAVRTPAATQRPESSFAEGPIPTVSSWTLTQDAVNVIDGTVTWNGEIVMTVDDDAVAAQAGT
jgi:hypothetical protein